ncbi:MAG: hypothetical protein L0206_19255, partial [Actinobacteria bacterium]|nr:hypothetical protein [Actinomycetota bacterium]
AYTALIVAVGVAAGIAVSNKDEPASTGGAQVSPNSVAIIDPEEYRVVASVRVGLRPRFVTATTGSVWVAAVESRSLTQIDSRTHQVRASIDLGFEPTDIEAVGESVWVVGGYDRVLWRVDSDAHVGLRLNLGDSYGPPPPGLARGRAGLAASDAGLWLAFGDKATLLDPVSGRALGDVDVGSGWLQDIDVGAAAVVESIASGRVYNFDPYTLEVGESLDTGTDVSTILVASGYAWIAKRAARQVWQVNEFDVTLRRTIEVDGEPAGLAFYDDAVWVATQGNSFVRRVDVRDGRVEASMALGHTPEGIVAANDLLWVAVRSP